MPIAKIYNLMLLSEAIGIGFIVSIFIYMALRYTPRGNKRIAAQWKQWAKKKLDHLKNRASPVKRKGYIGQQYDIPIRDGNVFIKIGAVMSKGKSIMDDIDIVAKRVEVVTGEKFVFILYGRRRIGGDSLQPFIHKIDVNTETFDTDTIDTRKRREHATAIDSPNKIIYSFGGFTGTGGNTRTPELHSYNITTQVETTLWDGAPALPEETSGADMVIDQPNQQLYIFGGFRETSGFSDILWRYDIALNTMTDVTPGTSPTARHYLKMVIKGSIIYLFGGLGSGLTRFNDLWKFDINTGLWTDISPVSKPGIRSSHGMAIRGSKIYVFGGLLYNNELWVYDIGTGIWTNITPASGNPSIRAWCPLVVSGNRLFTFAGLTSGFVVADPRVLWIYDIDEGAWSSFTLPNQTFLTQWAHTMEALD